MRRVADGLLLAALIVVGACLFPVAWLYSRLFGPEKEGNGDFR